VLFYQIRLQGSQVDWDRLQHLLRCHLPVISGDLVKKEPLVGGVEIDEEHPVRVFAEYVSSTDDRQYPL